jgi:hypothetical protein
MGYFSLLIIQVLCLSKKWNWVVSILNNISAIEYISIL